MKAIRAAAFACAAFLGSETFRGGKVHVTANPSNWLIRSQRFYTELGARKPPEALDCPAPWAWLPEAGITQKYQLAKTMHLCPQLALSNRNVAL